MSKGNSMVTFWVVLAILAASIEPIIVKLGFGVSASPLQLLAAKSIIGAALIYPLTRSFRWIGWKALGQLTVLALLLMTTSAMTILALEHLSAGCLITIITTTPAFVAIVNQKLGRDVLTTRFWLGFLLCFAGVVSWLDFSQMSWSYVGLLQVCIAVTSSTMYRVRSESATAQLSPAVVSTYLFWIIGLVAAIFILPIAGPVSSAAWSYGAWMGAAAACANVAFLYALSILGATRISILNMLQRPAIVLAAAVILHEPVSFIQIAGLILVLAGIQLATVKRIPRIENLEGLSPGQKSKELSGFPGK